MRLDLGPDLAALKAAALVRVDAAAERARQAFLTPGAGQALEYQRSEPEARAFLAALEAGGSPDLADYPFVRAEVDAVADATGAAPAPAAIAAEIVALADAWVAAGSTIKRLRRAAKLKIEAATTPAAIRAAESISWPRP